MTIEALPKTTFSGRRFTRNQLRQVQDTVRALSKLSRKELAQTICEHLDWRNPAGRLKVNSCLDMLEQLEAYGVITLPAKRETRAPVRRVPAFDQHPTVEPISDTLEGLGRITLQPVLSGEDRESFKAYLQTHHYLGYRQPVGATLGYFVVSEARQQKLGCLLFSASAAWALAARDEWIGWEKKQREKLLHLILSNDRFLVFPWVRVPNLASHILSLATRQVREDWVRVHGYRPVLIETFVDPAKYSGACYRAANWDYLGKTRGRGHFDPNHEWEESPKDIYAYPLEPKWREVLTNCHRMSTLKKKYRNDVLSSHTRSVDEAFVALWEKVVGIISKVAAQYDEKWQIRKRVIDTMLLVLLIFRLVSAKNSQGYGTTIDELWDSCDKLKVPLPQKGAIASSSFCTARKKLDESVFKRINERVIEIYGTENQEDFWRWHGHRLFAVDGTKINLPRELLSCGYKVPSENAKYPQGLVSCLYQLKSRLPFDFDLVSHANERTCALQHLLKLKPNDIVVYDRGYFSYFMLHEHLKSGIHAVFRLQGGSNTVFRKFFASSDTDIITDIYPSARVRRDLLVEHPGLEIVPFPLRLIKYQADNETYCIGTTLLDQSRYDRQEFSDVYHARWGVEELYKISKRLLIVEDFHGRTERGVKQELFAHFALITLNRLFANQADADLNREDNSTNSLEESAHPAEVTTQSAHPSANQGWNRTKTNFKNCIQVIARGLEELLLFKDRVRDAVERAYHFIAGRHQKDRPGRSYPRKSMRPETKWRPRKRARKTQLLPATDSAT